MAAQIVVVVAEIDERNRVFVCKTDHVYMCITNLKIILKSILKVRLL